MFKIIERSKCEHRRISRATKTLKLKTDTYILTTTRCTDCAKQLYKGVEPK